MRRLSLLLAFQSALVVAFAIALGSGVFPLGVRGEWEWPRVRIHATALDLMTALGGVGFYAAVVMLGWRSLSRRAGRWREGAWLVVLVLAAIVAQVLVQSGAPTGYGLTKWATLGLQGSSGYYTLAKAQARNPRRFWADYPRWIRGQDSLHVGTHPPGLFLASRAVLGVIEHDPGLARSVADLLPDSVRVGFREILGPLPPSDRASLAVIGLVTLLACSATVIPLYFLARASGLPPTAAWASAALWPLVPSAILFQPTADTAFPFLATAALALSARGRLGSALLAGVVLGVGMQFSLVFLSVGLVVAGVLLTRDTRQGMTAGADDRKTVPRLALLASTGLGFLAFTLATWVISSANPFVIWWWNQKNHARFYAEFPRSYGAWLIANPIELAIALGIPITIWALIGLRRAPVVAWATIATLAILTLSGRSLSEVARLWLPLMPPLLVAAGSGMHRLGGRAATLGATIALVGLQTVALQAKIQVVYPV